MATGYEVDMYRNTARIADALERIAAALEAQGKVDRDAIRREHDALRQRYQRASDHFSMLDRATCCYIERGEIPPLGHNDSAREAERAMQEAGDALAAFEARHPEVVP